MYLELKLGWQLYSIIHGGDMYGMKLHTSTTLFFLQNFNLLPFLYFSFVR